MLDWIYCDKPLLEKPADAVGFVYIIVNRLTLRKYIGKKNFIINFKRPPLKGKKRKRKCTKESNWKTYFGSCPGLLEDIEKYGHSNFYREILSIHNTKGATNTAETVTQFRLNVLNAKDENNNREYYNVNILGRYFASNEEFVSNSKINYLANWSNLSPTDKKHGNIIQPYKDIINIK